MSSVRAAAMEYLSGGEGADSSGLDAAQAAQQRAFVRGLLPGIGHSGAIPAHAPAPPPPPPAPDAPDLGEGRVDVLPRRSTRVASQALLFGDGQPASSHLYL